MDATSSSGGPATPLASSSTPPHTQIRSRITVVCAECKRLKLKCDRRTPCGSCVKRDTVPRCVYTAAASEKIDVQSLHNRQSFTENLLNWLLPKMGLTSDQIHSLGNNGTVPDDLTDFPALFSEGFAGVLAAAAASNPNPHTATTGASTSNAAASSSSGSDTSKPPATLIAYSSPPFNPFPTSADVSSNPSSSTALALSSSSALKRSKSSQQLSRPSKPAYERGSLGASTAVFGGSSILVPLEELVIWTENLGIDLTGPLSSSSGNNREDTPVVMERLHVQTATSEFDRSRNTNGDVNAVVLSVKLFMQPNPPAANPLEFSTIITAAITSNTPQIGVPPPSQPMNSTTSPPTGGYTNLLFGQLGPDAMSSSPRPSLQPSHLLQPAPPPVSAFSSSPPPSIFIPGVITRVHITYLPPATNNLRATLWAEFENVMVSHPCLSLKTLKRRADALFRWAEKTSGGNGNGGRRIGASGRAHVPVTRRVRTMNGVGPVVGIRSRGTGDDLELVGEYEDDGEQTGGDEAMTSVSAPAIISSGSNEIGRSKRRKESAEPGTTVSHSALSNSTPGANVTSPAANGGPTRRQRGNSIRESSTTASSSTKPRRSPTLAFLAVVAGAYALGAQAYTAKAVHGGKLGNSHSGYVPPPQPQSQSASDMRRRTTSKGGPRERVISGARRERTNSAAMAMDSTPGDTGTMSRGGETPGEDESMGGMMMRGSYGPTTPFPVAGLNPLTPHGTSSVPFPASSSTIPTILPKLATPYDAESLHCLCQAALTAHDTLGYAPSLDYIVAHKFVWLFKLHASSPSDPSGPDSSNTFGSSTTIDLDIWKSLGKIVNLARGMGLGVDPDESINRPSTSTTLFPSSAPATTPPVPDDEDVVIDDEGQGEGDADNEEHTDESATGAADMSLWEKEMRRRVWWDVCYYDLFVSDCMGFPPLIDDAQHTTKIPSDVDESQFGPTSTSLPPPRFGPQNQQPRGSGDEIPGEEVSEVTNFSYFVQKCKLLILMKSMKKRTFRDSTTGDLSIEAAKQFESEVQLFVKQLPKEFSLDFRSTSGGGNTFNSSAMDEDTSYTPAAGVSPYSTYPTPSYGTPANAFTPFTPATSYSPATDYAIPASFPASDILAAQACELRSMANALILKLWTPYLKPSQSRTQPNQSASLASATAAHGVIVSSHHLLNRFRFIRPASYSFYGFGRMVFHAGLVLANVVILSPEVLFAESALRGLEGAIEVMKDPVVAGLGMRHIPSSTTSTQDSTTGSLAKANISQATKILEIMKHTAESSLHGLGFALGSKRKHPEAETLSHLRTLGPEGFQLPYVGGPVTVGPIPGAASTQEEPTPSTGSNQTNVGLGITAASPFSVPTSSSMPTISSPVQMRARFSEERAGSQPTPPPVSAPANGGGIFWSQNAALAAAATSPVTFTTDGSVTRRRAGSTTSVQSDQRSNHPTEVSEMSSINAPKQGYPTIGIRDRRRTGGPVKVESATGEALHQLDPSRRAHRGGSSQKSDASAKSKKRERDGMSRSSQGATGPYHSRRSESATSHSQSNSLSSSFPHNVGISSLPPPPAPPPNIPLAPTTLPASLVGSFPTHRLQQPAQPHPASQESGMQPSSATSTHFSSQPPPMDTPQSTNGHLDYHPPNAYAQPPQPRPAPPQPPRAQEYHMSFPQSFGGASHTLMDRQFSSQPPTDDYSQTQSMAMSGSADQYTNIMASGMNMSGMADPYQFDSSGQGMTMSYMQPGPIQNQPHHSHQHHQQQQSSDDSAMIFNAGHVSQGPQQGYESQNWTNQMSHPSNNAGNPQWGSQMNYQ